MGKLKKVIIGVIAIFIVIVGLVNVFKRMDNSVKDKAGVSELAKIVTFDRGFDDSVKGGLTQEVNYTETKNGVTLRVLTVVGDYKSMWIGYKISSSDEEIETTEFNSSKPASIRWNSPDEDNKKMRYAQMDFENPVSDININIKAKGRKSNKILATFNVPISLNKDIKGERLREVKVTNPMIKTKVGDIKIVSLKSSKSTTVIEFNFISDNYSYYGFEEAILVTKSKTQKVSNSYPTLSKDNTFTVEFQGELKDVDDITFMAKGMYYGPKNSRKIEIDMKNKRTLPNYYNIQVESINKDSLVLVGKGIKSLCFNDLYDDSGNIVGRSSESSFSSGEDIVTVYYKLNKKVDKVNADIDLIYKDKTEKIITKI